MADATSNTDKIYRELSNCLLISADQFARQTPSKQSSIVLRANGKPVKFVANFLELANLRKLRDNLLLGKDVSIELEFNKIDLTSEDFSVIDAFRPVLAKIMATVPTYPWLPEETFPNISVQRKPNGEPKRIQRNNHDIGIETAKNIWNKASAFWAGGAKPNNHQVMKSYYGSGHRVGYSENSVSVGCQTITRAEVEHIARLMNWEPHLG